MTEHVMVDLETLGVTPGCMILSIGAVRFNPANGDIDPIGFYQAVDQKENFGLFKEKSTVEWWHRQGPEARAVFTDPRAVPLGVALSRLNGHLPAGAFVWGNGADFDNPILACAYRATGISQGWKPYNGRCYRTIKNLAPQVRLVRSGTHHNALDDARAQAQHLLDIVEYTSLTLA